MEKNESKKVDEIVGIVSRPTSEKNQKKKRNTGPVTLYWQKLVKVWFDVYAELIPAPPGEEKAVPIFDGTETANMKSLIKILKERAEKLGVEWNEQNACTRWKLFLMKAFEDDFISKNFMIRIISNNKTKIFNNQITPKKNGKGNAGSTGGIKTTGIKQKGGFGKL